MRLYVLRVFAQFFGNPFVYSIKVSGFIVSLPFLMTTETSTIHVSIHGDDSSVGSSDAPLRTISAAAQKAQPGDTVLIHSGIYREEIDPPRGGTSDSERITYAAADGEEVEIRGSEVIEGWEYVSDEVWTTRVPNSLFGDFNPYADLIRGDWFRPGNREHHTGAVYFDGQWLTEAANKDSLTESAETAGHWIASVDGDYTTFWAHFNGEDPNQGLTEINVRQAVFYPRKTGINYLTVRGLGLRHAATNWAPPTAEQVGAIGTNWSKGWIIEDNVISHSRSTGVTLGKYGDEFDNTSANTAEGYDVTIARALENGWDRSQIGSHVVRNNHISFCEQAGIVGSLGAVFCEVTGNTIHDIHVQRLFTGDEQAGIKFHAPIDTLIAGNRIFRTFRAMWMDWMTQGTRITGNLCYDSYEQDLFIEVDHGPFMVDHNVFLSDWSIMNWSEGTAFVHNLFGGRIIGESVLKRFTPYHEEHSTALAGSINIVGGDERFYNNLLVDRKGMEKHLTKIRPCGDDQGWNGVNESETFPSYAGGNAFLASSPGLVESDEGFFLEFDDAGITETTDFVSGIDSDRLGLSKITGLPYVNVDGKPFSFTSPVAGPFESLPTANKRVSVPGFNVAEIRA
ncbi:MAG: right-handed parallel beta-helix repeat-containing protein [Verrucomicrobiota bacterium]